MGTAATRLVGESVGRGGEGLIARMNGVAVVGVGASLLVGTVFLLLAPAVWQSGVKMSPVTLPLALSAVPAGAALVALTPAAAATYGVLTARELFLFAAGLRLYQGAGRLFAAVVVVYLGRGVAEVFWAQASVDLTAVLVGSVWSRRGTGGGPLPFGGADRSLLRTRDAVITVLAVGLPFALVSLLSGLLTGVEKLAIALARSVEDFTYYAVPFNAVIKFTVVSGAVVRVLMPRVAALGARGGAEEALQLTQRADRILVVGMVAVVTPFVVLAPELLQLWVGDVFALRSTLATRILLVGVAVNAAAIPAPRRGARAGEASPSDVSIRRGSGAPPGIRIPAGHRLRPGGSGCSVDSEGCPRRARATRARRTHDGAPSPGRPRGLGLCRAPRCTRRVGDDSLAASSAGCRRDDRGVCVLRLVLGHERSLLLDSLLPWRWGGGTVSVGERLPRTESVSACPLCGCRRHCSASRSRTVSSVCPVATNTANAPTAGRSSRTLG